MTTLQAPKGWAMEKYMCYGTIGVAVLVEFAFIIDMFTDFPFGGIVVADIFGILAGMMIAYMGYNALRDLK